MKIFDSMKKIFIILTVAATSLLICSCTKEDRIITVERQWIGAVSINAGEEPLSFCFDLGKTVEDNMVIAVKSGDIKKNKVGDIGNINPGDIDFGNLGDLSNLGELGEMIKLVLSLNDEDYIYSDYATLSYTLTYTGKDTGTITFKEPGITGDSMTVEFKNLTNTSVTISFDKETIELAATEKELKKISDNFFKMLF